MDSSRRAFFNQLAAGGVVACGELDFLTRLRPVSAAEAQATPDLVRLDPSIESTVRLLESTPRERLLEEVGLRIRRGLGYRELLAALLLAGVRNVQPRPEVGFKFHAVLVVNSAHLASLSSPAEHRWLPIFWALDYFKEAQAEDIAQGNWHMRPVEESAVPPAERAVAALSEALDHWNEGAADAAAASMARYRSSGEVFELLFRYGSRDFRSIGHKAIFVSNSLRTLGCIGWQHAEPVVRSLAYALLMHEEGNPAERDAPADRPGRNRQRVGQIRSSWLDGKVDTAATTELLATLRQASPDEASAAVVRLLNAGIGPQSIWDGLLLGAAELLMRKPGILTLHAVTTSNALYYAWRTSSNDDTRRLLLLQNAAFLPMFRQIAGIGGADSLSSDLQIDKLSAEPAPGSGALAAIFADVDPKPLDAARKVLGYFGAEGDPQALIDAARVLVFLKGTNSHDYKFSSAVLEDYYHLSPAWRDRYLAASVYRLRGSSEPDNDLVQRTRAALA